MPDNRYVFLSPHRDDICFSLGTLARITGGTLINLFTQSQYTAATEKDFSLATVRRVSALRQVEDGAFISICRLHEIDLGWLEAPLRGYRPFDGTNIDAEVDFFGSRLRKTLHALNRSAVFLKPWLFCPMGIGGHRDHLIVRNAVLRGLNSLEEDFSVAFYEDLHYASGEERRSRGVGGFLQAAKSRFYRMAIPLGRHAEDKLKMVSFYESQFETLPTTIALLTPVIPGAPPHEAIWSRKWLLPRLRLRVRLAIG